jgi:hypothetical protein
MHRDSQAYLSRRRTGPTNKDCCIRRSRSELSPADRLADARKRLSAFCWRADFVPVDVGRGDTSSQEAEAFTVFSEVTVNDNGIDPASGNLCDMTIPHNSLQEHVEQIRMIHDEIAQFRVVVYVVEKATLKQRLFYDGIVCCEHKPRYGDVRVVEGVDDNIDYDLDMDEGTIDDDGDDGDLDMDEGLIEDDGDDGDLDMDGITEYFYYDHPINAFLGCFQQEDAAGIMDAPDVATYAYLETVQPKTAAGTCTSMCLGEGTKVHPARNASGRGESGDIVETIYRLKLPIRCSFSSCVDFEMCHFISSLTAERIEFVFRHGLKEVGGGDVLTVVESLSS